MTPKEKECSEALCDLYNRIHGEEYSYEKEFDILSDLIEEHFSNPPLTWEEINVGEPIYDNESKYWILVVDKKEISNKLFKRKRPYFNAYAAHFGSYRMFEFDENRFYRKEEQI